MLTILFPDSNCFVGSTQRGESVAAPGSAVSCFPVAGRVLRQIFVAPQQALTNSSGIAHEGGDGGIVLLAVFEPANDGAVKSRTLGHVADAQTALFALWFQRLEGSFDIKGHPHRHHGVRLALAGTNQILERSFVLLNFFVDRGLSDPKKPTFYSCRLVQWPYIHGRFSNTEPIEGSPARR
jgi:hypothetical protein